MKSNLMCKVTRGALYALGLSAAIYAAPLYAQDTGSTTAGLGSATATASEEDIIVLPVFDIQGSQEGVYREKLAVTASGVVATVRETPLSIDVITSELLKDTGVNEIIDAFRYTPGISTQPDSVLNPADNLKIRGFNSGWILRNGFRRYYFQNGDGIDRIEIVRGPVAAFFGQAEPGGVINYITKKPGFEWKHSLKVTYGSDDFKKVAVDTQGLILDSEKFGKLGYRVISTYQDSESWKDYVSTERPYVLTALRYDLSDKFRMDLDYEYSRNEQTGGLRSALVANRDYLSDYEEWQAISRAQEWYRDTTDGNPRGRNPYNIEFTTRYPLAYSRDYFTTDTNFRNWTNRYPWMTNGYVDPRTGQPQYPIIARESDIGGRRDGTLSTPQVIDVVPSVSQSYRHGWRSIKMFEQIGGYVVDRDANGNVIGGRFVEVDLRNKNPAVIPALTEQVFPRGYSFNPNGPDAFYYDESHTASADLKFIPTEWISFRYGFNYLELINRQQQQFNSDTDMDGYTLDASNGTAGYGNGPNQATGSATGFDRTNQYIVHQLTTNLKFELGPAEHSFLFNVEYRDDHFEQYRLLSTNEFFAQGGPSSPGVGLWDIYNDPEPRYGSWAKLERSNRTWNDGNDTVQTGYSATYRMKTFSDRLQLWTGIRHERQQQYSLHGADNPTLGQFIGERSAKKAPVTGTTPMYGISFEVVKGINIYASYSESFISRNLTQETQDYRDPFTPLRPDLVAWLNDPENNPIPLNVTGSDFAFVPGSVPNNPKGVGYELGVKFEKNLESWGTLSGSAAVFNLERRGLIYSQNAQSNAIANRVDFINRTLGYQVIGLDRESGDIYTNAGDEQTQGIELSLTYVPTPDLQINLGISYLFVKEVKTLGDEFLYGDINQPPGVGDGPMYHPSLFYWDPARQLYLPKWNNNNNGVQELGEKDNTEVYLPKFLPELANVPDLQFSIQARYDFREKWGFLNGARAIIAYSYEGDSPVSVNSPGSVGADYVLTAYRNPEVHLVDLTLGYKYELKRGELDFSVNIRNLFDDKYTKGSFGILDPRTIFFNVEYKF